MILETPDSTEPPDSTEQTDSLFLTSGKSGTQEEVWGQSVLPIHKKYLTSAFPFHYKKGSHCDSTGNKRHFGINSTILQPSSPSRLPGNGAPLLPLTGIEFWSHCPSASFVTFQSYSKAGTKYQWAQKYGTARGHGTSTLPALLELPVLPGLTQKTFLLVSPQPQLGHHKHTGKNKERNIKKKMLIGKGFVQLHNSSYKTFVIIDFCP